MKVIPRITISFGVNEQGQDVVETTSYDGKVRTVHESLSVDKYIVTDFILMLVKRKKLYEENNLTEEEANKILEPFKDINKEVQSFLQDVEDKVSKPKTGYMRYV